jgi:streptomycin 6-kinase
VSHAGEDVEPTFRSSVTRLVGADAREWLAGLPALEAEIAARWDLELGAELPGGLLASVRAVRCADGNEAVLKLAGPWDRTADEIACLRVWAGGPAPTLLEADEERSALLLEGIVPGTPETDADPETVASLLAAIHVPDVLGLRALEATVSRRLDRAEREGRATPQRLAWARTAIGRLHEDTPAATIVHGDFDERNLLACARRGLCAIDPLPCSGDGTYDAAYWVHANRRPGRRARFEAILAAAGLDRERLKDWCAVIAVHG